MVELTRADRAQLVAAPSAGSDAAEAALRYPEIYKETER